MTLSDQGAGVNSFYILQVSERPPLAPLQHIPLTTGHSQSLSVTIWGVECTLAVICTGGPSLSVFVSRDAFVAAPEPLSRRFPPRICGAGDPGGRSEGPARVPPVPRVGAGGGLSHR
eukprot:6564109-Pyramimonas_sp.AAC.1